MSADDVYRCVSSCGVPCVRNAWPKGSAPPLPWAVFALDEEGGCHADGETYVGRASWYVELYQRSNDPELEASLRSAIESSFGPATRTDAWVEQESCVQTTYYFTEIERG